MASNEVEKGAFQHTETLGDEKADTLFISGDSHHKSKAERRLVLKQDLTIFPLVSVMLFFAYVDRGQIGNARIMGLEADLKLAPSQFYNCLMMFYIGYMVFELPALFALRIFRPGFIYGGGMIVFGILATCVAFSGSYAGLMVIRVLLGFAEASAQTVYVYLSMWYKHDEMALRTCAFFIAAPIAGAFSGLIAYAVDLNLQGASGLRSWQWLFVVEGVPTIVWGILMLFLTPSMPDTVARDGSMLFKTEEEKLIILQRTTAAQNEVHDNAKIRPFQIWLSLKDIKTWLSALTVGAAIISVAAFTTLLPTFIKAFGFSRLNTQLYSMIPYGFATVTTAGVSILSDRIRRKAVPLFVCFSISIVGLIILLATTNKVALVAGACFVASGAYPSCVLAASWLVTTNAGYTKRCTAWAVAQVFGQCYSIISAQVYITPPRYFMGHGILLGLISLGLAAAVANYTLMKRDNARKDEVAAEHKRNGTTNTHSATSLEELVEKHPDYRYAI